MMATLATTAAPKFSGVGEGAKEKKTMADIDKIVKSANNFYNSKVTTEGRGRFPGQVKYDEAVGLYASEADLLVGVDSYTAYDSQEGLKWASVFGTTTLNAAGEATIPDNHSVGVSEVALANEDARLNVFASTTFAKYAVPFVNQLSCVPPAV